VKLKEVTVGMTVFKRSKGFTHVYDDDPYVVIRVDSKVPRAQAVGIENKRTGRYLTISPVALKTFGRAK
jgi:hypothetical protein